VCFFNGGVIVNLKIDDAERKALERKKEKPAWPGAIFPGAGGPGKKTFPAGRSPYPPGRQ
jgi:hypothetical protein